MLYRRNVEKIASYETLSELDQDYPVQCLRKVRWEADVFYDAYEAIYLGEEKILIDVFHMDKTKWFSRILNFSVESPEFSGLLIGDSLFEKVMVIDPLGDYLFLYTGRGEPRVSRHYFRSGYMIEITYDEQFDIETIERRLI